MTTATQPKHCFARNHMTMRQYGLYTTIRELQSKWGYVWFDGDDIAASFATEPAKTKTPKVRLNPKTQQPTKSRRFGASRDAVYDDCKSLLDAGWFVELQPRNRKKDGTWEARKLAALSHKDWSVKYPDKCLNLQESQLARSDWSSRHVAIDQLASSDSPVGTERLTSRHVAIDQWAPCLQRLGSRADMVPTRPDSKERQGSRAEGDLVETASVSFSNQTVAPDCPRPEVPPTAIAEILDDGVLVGWQLKDGSEVMLGVYP